MRFIERRKVKDKFESYPVFVRKKMYALRGLVIHTAKEIEEIEKLEETHLMGRTWLPHKRW
jgi:hypothetical protein